MSEESFLIDSLPGVISWAIYDESVKTYLTSHAIIHGSQLVLIDPVPISPEVEETLMGAGKPVAILLTNGNHERATTEMKRRFSIPMICSAEAVPHITEKPELVLESQKELYGIKFIPNPGAGPGEYAFHYPYHDALFIGDALINLKNTGFQILPDKYCQDPKLLKSSLKKLLDYQFACVYFAHGNMIDSDPKIAMQALFI